MCKVNKNITRLMNYSLKSLAAKIFRSRKESSMLSARNEKKKFIPTLQLLAKCATLPLWPNCTG